MYTSRDVAEPVQVALAHHREIIDVTPAVPEPDKHYVLQVEDITEIKPCVRLALYETLFTAHKQEWESYWRSSKFVIEGDRKAQTTNLFKIFQLDNRHSSHATRH